MGRDGRKAEQMLTWCATEWRAELDRVVQETSEALSDARSEFNEVIAQRDRAQQTVRDREAELLRCRTAEQAAAHALDNLRVENNIDPGEPHEIAAALRRMIRREPV